MVSRALIKDTRTVRLTQTGESHPMPNAPVAMYRVMMPGIAGAIVGIPISSALYANPPNRVRRKKDMVSTREPPRSKALRPRASIKIQAKVMSRKYET